jgi:hypothetical protein
MVRRINIIDPAGLHRLESLNSSAGFDFKYSLSPDRVDFNVYIGDPKLLHRRRRESKSIFLLTEPPEILRYDVERLSEFDLVIGPSFDYLGNLSNRIDSHPLLQAFGGFNFPIGTKNFFKRKYPQYTRPTLHNFIPKQKAISVIMSDKRITEMHRLRLDFVDFMLKHSGLQFELYGRNFAPVSDKFETLSYSKFHLAFENSIHLNYVTEKLHDPIIANNHVFYVGAPNVHDFYSQDRVTILDPSNFRESMMLVCEHFNKSETENFFGSEDSTKYFDSYSLEASLSRILLRI